MSFYVKSLELDQQQGWTRTFLSTPPPRGSVRIPRLKSGPPWACSLAVACCCLLSPEVGLHPWTLAGSYTPNG